MRVELGAFRRFGVLVAVAAGLLLAVYVTDRNNQKSNWDRRTSAKTPALDFPVLKGWTVRLANYLVANS